MSARSGAPGALIVFEGGDGAGKTTQTTLLCERLERRGYAVRRTFEPGDSPAGQHIRRLLLDPATGALSPRTEALLYAADKAEHIASVVAPALERGEVVVCDRYIDSMLAYQGAHGTDVGELRRLAEWATAGLRADLTVLLDVDPSVGVGAKVAKDRIEGYAGGFHERARALFRGFAEADSARYLVVAGRDPIDAIADQVEARAVDVLRARNCPTRQAQ